MNQIAPDNIEAWTELNYAYSTLGSLFLKQLKYTESYNAFTSSLAIIERTIAKQPQDPILRLDKSDTLSWLATTEQALGHLSLALKLHQEAQQEIELGLQYEPNNAGSLEILAYSHWHQTRLLNYLGKYDNAYNKAELATETLKTILQQDSENEDWKKALLKIEIFKIKILIGKGSVDNEVSPTLVEQYTTDIFNETSIGLMNFAYLIEYYQSNKAWHKSSELIDKTSRYLSNYSSINKMDAEYQLGLAELTLLKAKQFAKNNQVELSSQACEETIKLLSPLVKVSRNVEYLLPYARAHSCLNKLEFIPEEIAALLSMQVTNYDFTH